MNYLMLSVGRRGELLKNFKRSFNDGSKLIATDLSPYAPAMYFADKRYLMPPIDDAEYIEKVLEICKKENVSAVMTFIDPEIELLAKNRNKFEAIGVEVLVPYKETAELCFDKFLMFKYLQKCNIPTVNTYGSFQEFEVAYNSGIIDFPVFVKPRTGSGSVGARKVANITELAEAVTNDETLIIQEFMNCTDLDADVYVDTISHKAVSAFLKRKLETRIGGASKTISFIDNELFEFIQKICGVFKFSGPIDMDFFYCDGKYYLSEINPRFGGAYLHAYGAGVDFIRLIENNLNGNINMPVFGDYAEGIVMMMYDSVVIKKADELTI